MGDLYTAAQLVAHEAQAAPYVRVRLDAGALLALLHQAPAIIEDEIRAALEEIGARFEAIGAEEAPEGALGGSGGLRGSVYHELRGTPARTLLAGWAAPHADYVLRGRRPGKMPPEAPILLWVRRALDVPDKQARSVAYLVRRAIGRRGTKGNPFDVRTLRRLEPLANALLARAADRAAARIGGSR